MGELMTNIFGEDSDEEGEQAEVVTLILLSCMTNRWFRVVKRRSRPVRTMRTSSKSLVWNVEMRVMSKSSVEKQKVGSIASR